LSPVQLMLFMAQVSRQHSCNISGKVQWRHLSGNFELWTGAWWLSRAAAIRVRWWPIYWPPALKLCGRRWHGGSSVLAQVAEVFFG